MNIMHTLQLLGCLVMLTSQGVASTLYPPYLKDFTRNIPSSKKHRWTVGTAVEHHFSYTDSGIHLTEITPWARYTLYANEHAQGGFEFMLPVLVGYSSRTVGATTNGVQLAFAARTMLGSEGETFKKLHLVSRLGVMMLQPLVRGELPWGGGINSRLGFDLDFVHGITLGMHLLGDFRFYGRGGALGLGTDIFVRKLFDNGLDFTVGNNLLLTEIGSHGNFSDIHFYSELGYTFKDTHNDRCDIRIAATVRFPLEYRIATVGLQLGFNF